MMVINDGYWLVVWNMNGLFSPIVGMMILSDFLSIIFQGCRWLNHQDSSGVIVKAMCCRYTSGTDRWVRYFIYLVGGLEHGFSFSIYYNILGLA
jgi:hypothetical protein